MRLLAHAFALLALTAPAGPAMGPTRAPDVLESARPYYKLIMENDAVRVFETVIPSGQTAPAHHLGCRVVYALANQAVRTTTLDGVTSDSRKPFRAAWWRGADDLAVTNMGREKVFNLVVEFKGQVPGSTGCANAVPPTQAAAWAAPGLMTWATDDKTGVASTGLIGASNAPGPFVQRVRLPKGYRAKFHAHNTRLDTTVISGEVRLRFQGGDAEVVLPAGSFVTIPAGLAHEEWSVTGAELEERGEGPLETTLHK